MSSAHVSLDDDPAAVVELAEDERAHAVRVAERVEGVLGDEHDGVGAVDELHGLADAVADVVVLLREVSRRAWP